MVEEKLVAGTLNSPCAGGGSMSRDMWAQDSGQRPGVTATTGKQSKETIKTTSKTFHSLLPKQVRLRVKEKKGAGVLALAALFCLLLCSGCSQATGVHRAVTPTPLWGSPAHRHTTSDSAAAERGSAWLRGWRLREERCFVWREWNVPRDVWPADRTSVNSVDSAVLFVERDTDGEELVKTNPAPSVMPLPSVKLLLGSGTWGTRHFLGYVQSAFQRAALGVPSGTPSYLQEPTLRCARMNGRWWQIAPKPTAVMPRAVPILQPALGSARVTFSILRMFGGGHDILYNKLTYFIQVSESYL